MATGSGTIGPRTTSPLPTVVDRTAELASHSAIRSAWVEARPAVQIIFQLRLLAIVAVASMDAGTVPNWTSVALCCCGWLFVTWSIYLLNGLSDRVEDRVNGSRRPLAQGTLDARVAGVFVLILACAGVLLCLWAGLPVMLSSAVMLVLGIAYSAGPSPLQNSVWGVQLSAFGGGLATYAAGTVAAGTSLSPAVIVFSVAMSAWMCVGGLAKDLSDVDGDRVAGRSTLAMWSERGTTLIVAALAATVAGGFLYASWTVEEALVVPALLLSVGAAAISARAATNHSHRRKSRVQYNAFMCSQYGVHIAAMWMLL
ncbi:MAG: UbiA family prenyltransferase [Rhodococcus sp. (in: high G+C Gram-positive bacteria)]